jgi:hypothetical protein
MTLSRTTLFTTTLSIMDLIVTLIINDITDLIVTLSILTLNIGSLGALIPLITTFGNRD